MRKELGLLNIICIFVALGFLAVYILWGSTYLAIRIGTDPLQAFLRVNQRASQEDVAQYIVDGESGIVYPLGDEEARQRRGAIGCPPLASMQHDAQCLGRFGVIAKVAEPAFAAKQDEIIEVLVLPHHATLNLIVDPRSWWPGQHVLVSTEWIMAVHWNDSTVQVDLTREAVRNAAPVARRTRSPIITRTASASSPSTRPASTPRSTTGWRCSRA